METDENNRNANVLVSRNLCQLGTEELPSRQEQMMKADIVLKSLSPLTNSMRAFGLYFTRVGHSPTTTSHLNRRCNSGCKVRNAARIYAAIMLVVTWLNAARYCILIEFHTKILVNADLFYKVGVISTAMLSCVLSSAYYVASHKGSLDRVFCQAEWSAADLAPKYSRRAKVVTTVCWTLLSWNISYYIIAVCISREFNDDSLLYFIKTFPVLDPYADIMKFVFIVLQLESFASLTFPQAMVSCTSSIVDCLLFAYGTPALKIHPFPLSHMLHRKQRFLKQ